MFINWHFTAFVVNLVIIDVYLAYLNRSLINNTYSKMESLNLIAYPSKNVKALELCRRFSFSIVKIYFHHRLPLFLHLQSSEHRFVFARNVSSQVTSHFHCYCCHVVGFAILRVNPGTRIFWVWEKFPIPQFVNIRTLRDAVPVIGIESHLLYTVLSQACLREISQAIPQHSSCKYRIVHGQKRNSPVYRQGSNTVQDKPA